ncbi:MAG: PilZ domain-containing protein [Defluviitaleaceae bacterium]|nr:PilZ domain-containing protein [Defluviitaleaceae bacterium]
MSLEFDDGSEMEVVFDGNKDHMQFYVINAELLTHVEQYIDMQPKVQFLANNVYYNFTAQVLGKSDRKGAFLETVDMRVISPFKEAPQRQSFRISLNLKVRVHEYIDDFRKLYTNGWLLDAVSDDMSKNGIRLFTDHVIPPSQNNMYTLEFSLQGGSIYMVPARLKRNQANTATRSYNYDYGFIFDFSQMPEKQEQLLLEILEHKIKHRL